MKNPIKRLNKVFDSRVRLGIMSALMVNHWLDFNSLKSLLEVTDGNLATHLRALENNRYIIVKKQFMGRKPKTSYQATSIGRMAFNEHLNELENLIQYTP